METPGGDWADYWRAPGSSIEGMRAHIETHRYHRHSHDTYSFGITESGAQAFNCRGANHTSWAGLVMAFNPEDPHDGHAADALGFTYSIVYIDASAVMEILGDQRGRRTGSPLFAEPVLHDQRASDALRRLNAAIADGGQRLAVDEMRDAAIRALVRSAQSRTDLVFSGGDEPGSRRHDDAVERVHELLRAEYAREIGADELAAVAGRSRFALYRAFVARFGMSPGDYQRQLRLRSARRLLAAGLSPAQAATDAGFTDQAHLNRWFRRCYGITPARYQAAAIGGTFGEMPEPSGVRLRYLR